MNRNPTLSGLLAFVAMVLATIGATSASVAEVARSTFEEPAHERGKRFNYENARVPGACGWKGGRLEDGELRRRDPQQGNPKRIFLVDGRRDGGTLSDDRRYYAATIGCGQDHRGPDTAVVWSRDGTIAWSYDVSNYSGEFETYVRDIRFTETGLIVLVDNIQQADDYFYAGSLVARLKIDIVDGLFSILEARTVDERTAAYTFIDAVIDGDVATAASVSSKKLARDAVRRGKGGEVRSGDCIGRAADGWPTWVDTNNIRMCYMTISSGEHGSGYGLFMKRYGWRTWKVDEFVGVAG